MRLSGTALGPSESASAGFGCVSIKNPATPTAHGRAREHRNELTLTAGTRAVAAGELHGMRRIHDNRRAVSHA